LSGNLPGRFELEYLNNSFIEAGSKLNWNEYKVNSIEEESKLVRRKLKMNRNGKWAGTYGSDPDVIMLGVGTSGEDLSLQLLDAGLDVVGIEASLVGGTCPFYGCLPSKMMVRAANLLKESERVNGMSGQARTSSDWSQVAERVSQLTGGWNDAGGVKRFEQRGGRLIHGAGKMTGPRTVTVDGKSFTARKGIVIATGTKPVIPPISGLDKVSYWITDDVIKLDKLPESIIFLGGGATSCELGQVMARFGVKVTIVEPGDRVMRLEEPEASEKVEEAFTGDGITVHKGMKASEVEPRGSSIVSRLDGGAELVSERLVLATGRKTDLTNLGLESAGIDSSKRFIEVDERMRAADGIWAMGDVTGKAMLTHVALYQAAIIAADILGKNHPPAEYHSIPRVTFTDPEVGAVGFTEAAAREAGFEVVAVTKQIDATFRGILHGSNGGFIKLIADRRTGALVGATAVGSRGGEILGLLTLAVHARIPITKLRSMIYAFPTFAGGIGEALGAYGRGVTTVLDPGYTGLKELDQLIESLEGLA
jgi:pyruvate/2-oxoglutarate dehydrogenase complex dihydrolipoamide dehydrogenase (E3) component